MGDTPLDMLKCADAVVEGTDTLKTVLEAITFAALQVSKKGSEAVGLYAWCAMFGMKAFDLSAGNFQSVSDMQRVMQEAALEHSLLMQSNNSAQITREHLAMCKVIKQ